MKKIVTSALAMLAAICIGAGAVFAAGTPPTPGQAPSMPDGTWLLGVANGINASYQSGISAAGTTQQTATQLPASVTLIEVDTVTASTGVNLVTAVPGIEISIYNNTSTTLTIYPTVANNPATAAQDTINNSTSTTLNGHTSLYCFAAKAGIWACK